MQSTIGLPKTKAQGAVTAPFRGSTSLPSASRVDKEREEKTKPWQSSKTVKERYFLPVFPRKKCHHFSLLFLF